MISVIIPTYNGETTISKCLDSLIQQNNQDFEVIIINDGSTDNTCIACDYYAKKDSRISIITIPNSGVSNARNIGLQRAKGDWIAFVDADDYVDPDYLTIPQINDSIDVIEKGYTILSDETSERVEINNAQVYFKGKSLDDYFKDYISWKTRALWNKLFRRPFIHETKFKAGISMGEDFIFFLELYPRINVYATFPLGEYFYNVNPHSATAINSKNISSRISGLIENAKLITKFRSNVDSPLYTFIIINLYLPLIAEYKDSLTYEQRKEYLLLERSNISGNYKLAGEKQRIFLTMKYVKDLLTIKYG